MLICFPILACDFRTDNGSFRGPFEANRTLHSDSRYTSGHTDLFEVEHFQISMLLYAIPDIKCM